MIELREMGGVTVTLGKLENTQTPRTFSQKNPNSNSERRKYLRNKIYWAVRGKGFDL